MAATTGTDDPTTTSTSSNKGKKVGKVLMWILALIVAVASIWGWFRAGDAQEGVTALTEKVDEGAEAYAEAMTAVKGLAEGADTKATEAGEGLATLGKKVTENEGVFNTTSKNVATLATGFKSIDGRVGSVEGLAGETRDLANQTASDLISLGSRVADTENDVGKIVLAMDDVQTDLEAVKEESKKTNKKVSSFYRRVTTTEGEVVFLKTSVGALEKKVGTVDTGLGEAKNLAKSAKETADQTATDLKELRTLTHAKNEEKEGGGIDGVIRGTIEDGEMKLDFQPTTPPKKTVPKSGD